MFRYHELQESAQAFIASEPRATQDPFQLLSRCLHIQSRDAHCSSIPLLLNDVRMYETPFQHSGAGFVDAAGGKVSI
jgi:hypothetical protein